MLIDAAHAAQHGAGIVSRNELCRGSQQCALVAEEVL